MAGFVAVGDVKLGNAPAHQLVKREQVGNQIGIDGVVQMPVDIEVAVLNGEPVGSQHLPGRVEPSGGKPRQGELVRDRGKLMFEAPGPEHLAGVGIHQEPGGVDLCQAVAGVLPAENDLPVELGALRGLGGGFHPEVIPAGGTVEDAHRHPGEQKDDPLLIEPLIGQAEEVKVLTGGPFDDLEQIGELDAPFEVTQIKKKIGGKDIDKEELKIEVRKKAGQGRSRAGGGRKFCSSAVPAAVTEKAPAGLLVCIQMRL